MEFCEICHSIMRDGKYSNRHCGDVKPDGQKTGTVAKEARYIRGWRYEV